MKLNAKLEGITVRDVVIEEAESLHGPVGNWRIYAASLSHGQAPFFLFVPGYGKVALGSTDIYWDKMLSPGELPLMFDEREAYDFSKFDFKLKSAFARIGKSKDVEWQGFADELGHYRIYQVAPPVSETELLTLSKEEMMSAVEKHVCGGFEVDERIRSWGYGNLPRFPQHTRFARWAKHRGHTLIIKSTKSGCSSIAQRIAPTYDHISPKSFEGYADADGDVAYSPLHGNFHACVLDEIDQLTDGIMMKTFGFMEGGRYMTVKAAKQICNTGNCRISFITNPKSMDENKGTVYAVDSVLDAFYNVLYKLTGGNFNGGMSRFGNVIVSSKVKQARGKELVAKDQELANAISTSLFEVIAPKVAAIYENEQPQAWLSQSIGYYDDEVQKLIKDFSDSRLRQAWSGQMAAFRHMRGAALEVAIAENSHEILHAPSGDTTLIADLVEAAEAVLNQVVDWNLTSLKEIINYSSRPENPEDLFKRLQLTRPDYVLPVAVAAARAQGEGSMTDLEVGWETLPRVRRDAIGGKNYYCWAHISRQLNKEALKRLGVALESFGFEVLHYPELRVRASAQLKKLLLELAENPPCQVLEQNTGSFQENIVPRKAPLTTPTTLCRRETEKQNYPELPYEQGTQGSCPEKLPYDVKIRVSDVKIFDEGIQGSWGTTIPEKIIKPLVGTDSVPISTEPDPIQGSQTPTIKRLIFHPDGTKEEVDY